MDDNASPPCRCVALPPAPKGITELLIYLGGRPVAVVRCASEQAAAEISHGRSQIWESLMPPDDGLTIPPVPAAAARSDPSVENPSAEITAAVGELRAHITTLRTFAPPDNATPLLRNRLNGGEAYLQGLLVRMALWAAAIDAITGSMP